MGGVGDTYACAAEMTRAWEHADHFELYDDVLPALAALRRRGLKARAALEHRARPRVCSSRTTRSKSTRCSPRGCTARPSRTRRSSVACSSCSTSRRRGGDGRRLARGRHRGRAARSACRRVLIDRERPLPGRSTGASTDSRGLPAALGLSKLASWVGSSGCSLRSLLAVGEVLTPGLFFLGPVALAAARCGRSPHCSARARSAALIVFIVCSVASLAILRPIARSHIRMPALSRTGTDALVGRKGIVTRRSTATAAASASAARSGARARTSTTRCSPRAPRSTSSRSRAPPPSSPNRRSQMVAADRRPW